MSVIEDIMLKNGFGPVKKNQANKCPFCGTWHLFVDTDKDVFTCFSNRCDLKGGYTDFALMFYRDVCGLNIKNKREAMNEYKKDMGISEQQFQFAQKQKVNKTTIEKEIPIERRNTCYRKMQELFPLKAQDKDELIQRGYSEAGIKAFGYISLPVTPEDRRFYASKLIEAGIDLNKMAGFAEMNGRSEVADFGFMKRLKEFGYEGQDPNHFSVKLIPAYDLHKNLQYFLIGWDKRISTNKKKGIIAKSGRDYPKYSVFSTPRYKGGGKVKSECGYVGPYKRINGQIIPSMHGQNYIPVIEGMLKGPLYRALLKRACNKDESVIVQNGVKNYGAVKRVLTELKQTNPEIITIVDCYDMDRFQNEDVMAGSEKLKKIALELGFKYGIRLWDPNYKGIDDYAKAICDGKIKTDKASMNRMRESIFAYVAKYHLKKRGNFYDWE